MVIMMIHPKKLCNFVFRRNQSPDSGSNPVYKSESFRFIQKTDSFLLPPSRRSFKVPVSENYVDPIDRHSAWQNGKEEPPYDEISEQFPYSYNAPYYYSETIKEEDPSYCSPCTVQRTDNSSISSSASSSSSLSNDKTKNNNIMKKPQLPLSSSKSSQQCYNKKNNIKMTVLHQKEENEDDLLNQYHHADGEHGPRRRHQFVSICQIRNSPSSTMTSSSRSKKCNENCVKRLIISDTTNNVPDLYFSSSAESEQAQSCFSDCDYGQRLKMSDLSSSVVNKSENQQVISNGGGRGGQMIMINNNHFTDHYCLNGDDLKPSKTPAAAAVEESTSRSSTISSCVDSGICLDDTLSFSMMSTMTNDDKSKSVYCCHGLVEECGQHIGTNDGASGHKKSLQCSQFCDTHNTQNSRGTSVNHFYARVDRNLSSSVVGSGGGYGGDDGGVDNRVGESQQPDHFTNVKCAHNNNNIQHHKRSEKVAPQISHNEPPSSTSPTLQDNNKDDGEEQEQICNNNLVSHNAVQMTTTMMMMGDINLLLCSAPAPAATATVEEKDGCIYYYLNPQCYSHLAKQYRYRHRHRLALDPSVKLESQDWFHGRITRVEAESMLKTVKVASFLVRNCEKSNQLSKLNHFSLSIKCSSGFIHIRIEPNPDGTYTLAEQEFPSVPHLIQHFMLHRLPIKGAQHLKLVYPVITQFL